MAAMDRCGRYGWKADIWPASVAAMGHRPTLHMFCGKIGSGKSTLAAQFAAEHQTILISEDRLLANLYPGEIVTLGDYVRCSDRLRQTIAPHIVELLRKGISVALDFQANTTSVRAWMRGLIESANCSHQLHVLQTPDVVCRERLAARNASGTHEYQVSNADFDLFSSYFVGPDAEEGFNVVLHGG